MLLILGVVNELIKCVNLYKKVTIIANRLYTVPWLVMFIKFIRVIYMEEKAPLDITIDKDGNAYVCYRDTNEISVWSNDFKERTILLNEDDLGKEPCCILYSSVDESLYVSYLSDDKSNIVDRFRLF